LLHDTQQKLLVGGLLYSEIIEHLQMPKPQDDDDNNRSASHTSLTHAVLQRTCQAFTIHVPDVRMRMRICARSKNGKKR